MKLNGCLREVSKVFQGCNQDILRVFQGILWCETCKGVSRYIKEVQTVFQGGFRDVLRKFQGCLKKVSSVCQVNFKNVLFCNFIVAWISSQLPEQKEGLFTIVLTRAIYFMPYDTCFLILSGVTCIRHLTTCRKIVSFCSCC